MDIAKKIVTKLPLEELWNEKGMLHARRVSSCLNAADVIDMIIAGATFVIADVGQTPRWIDTAHRFDFGKLRWSPDSQMLSNTLSLSVTQADTAISPRNGNSLTGFH